jgi:hypothetical protein
MARVQKQMCLIKVKEEALYLERGRITLIKLESDLMRAIICNQSKLLQDKFQFYI